MNDSLADAAGKGLTINIKGKEYELSILTIDDLAEFEKYIKSERLGMFLKIGKDLDSKSRAEAIAAVTSEHLTTKDLAEEMQSMTGTRFFLWRALLHKQPKFKLEEMGKLVDLDNLNEVSTMVQDIGGKTVKNAPGGKVSK